MIVYHIPGIFYTCIFIMAVPFHAHSHVISPYPSEYLHIISHFSKNTLSKSLLRKIVTPSCIAFSSLLRTSSDIQDHWNVFFSITFLSMRYRSEVLTCIVVGRFRYRMVRQPTEALLHFLLLCYIYRAPFIDLLDHVTQQVTSNLLPNQTKFILRSIKIGPSLMRTSWWPIKP